MSFECVPIYGLMFRILTRFHVLYFEASCFHRNSIVWRRVNLARFPYWPEKRKRRISRHSYLMKTLISSEYGLTISGHVTVLRQWLSEKNTNYIIMCVKCIENIWAMGDFQLFPLIFVYLNGYFFSTGLPKNQAGEILANLCKSFPLRCVQILPHPNMIALPILEGSETIANS